MSPPEDVVGERPELSVLASPARLAAVARLIGSGPVGARLDLLVAFVAELLDAPFAQVSLLTATEQVIAAAYGVALTDESRHGPLTDSMCAVTAASGQALVVADARAHPWVRDLPAVRRGPVAAYLGVVVTDAAGHVVGSLCVYDAVSRAWTDEQVGQLSAVAGLVSAELERHANSLHQEAAGVRTNLAAEAADLGSFVYDFAGTGQVDWDERMMALHGVTDGTFAGTLEAFEALVHPDDLAAVRHRFTHARDTAGELVLEYRVLLPEDRTRWIRIRARVMPDMLGTPSLLVGAAYDASTERGLRDELTRLMETMPAGLVRIDRDWTISYINAVAEGIYGRRREELVGRNVWQEFPEARGTRLEREYRQVMDSGEPATLEAYLPAQDVHFEVRIWPDEHGLTLFFHDVSERKRAHLALESVSARLAVIADAGSRLAGSLRPRQVLDVLADIVVPALGRSLAVAVTDPVAELLGLPAGNDPTRLHLVHVRHSDRLAEQELRAVLDALDLHSDEASAAGLAVRTGRPQAYPRVPEEFMRVRAVDQEHLEQMRRLNRGPHFTLPLGAPGGILGVLTVAGSEDQPLDEVLLVDLATRAAVALDNALSFARQHQAATVLQRALLPRTAPMVPDVQVATRYLPASAHALAGGDFFKTVNVAGRLVCALGDVMGHGTASAARAGQLHGLVAALTLSGLGPADLLTQLAAGVDQMMDLELATLLVCSYDPVARTLTAASAGHPPPLLAPLDGAPYYLELEPGVPIGVIPDSYTQRTCVLPAGATMVLFSDGLVERRTESLSTGLERLRASVDRLRLPPEEVADHILRELHAQDGGDDDIALLVLAHP